MYEALETATGAQADPLTIIISTQAPSDQDLLSLHNQMLISHDEALKNATNREALTMALRGISSSKSITDPRGGGPGQVKPGARPAPAASSGDHGR